MLIRRLILDLSAGALMAGGVYHDGLIGLAVFLAGLSVFLFTGDRHVAKNS